MAKIAMFALTDSARMDSYKKLVDDVMRDATLGDRNVLRVFENSGEEHARIVIDAMLNSAVEDVGIFGEEALGSVFDADLLRKTAEQPGMRPIRFLLEAKSPFDRPTSALPDLIDLVVAGKIEVRHLSTQPKSRLGHFTVVDGQHVRLERDHPRRKAIVAFGAPELASSAAELFDILWEDAEAVSPVGAKDHKETADQS